MWNYQGGAPWSHRPCARSPVEAAEDRNHTLSHVLELGRNDVWIFWVSGSSMFAQTEKEVSGQSETDT